MNIPEQAPAGGAVSAQGASSAASIPFLRHEGAGAESPAMGVGGALAGVLFLAVAAIWLLRHFARGRGHAVPGSLGRVFGVAPPRSLSVLESTRLTTKASAHVVRWKNREWLVLCTEQSATVMGQSPVADERAGQEPQP